MTSRICLECLELALFVIQVYESFKTQDYLLPLVSLLRTACFFNTTLIQILSLLNMESAQ